MWTTAAKRWHALLGYAHIAPCERNDAPQTPGFREEEFYLEPWGVDCGMAVMAPQLEGALLVSWRSGEAVWERGTPRHRGLPDLQIRCVTTPGCALGELRLRTGFLHLAPATIGLIHAPAIHSWNDAPEMQRWSIGGRYDKPLARRIVEEAGVPRELFGQVKKGGPEKVEGAEDGAGVLAGLEPEWLRAVLRRVVGHRGGEVNKEIPPASVTNPRSHSLLP